MGAKLDQAHAHLARISSALTEEAAPILEAKRKKPKFKAGSPKEKKGQGPGRKKRKQQANQDAFYQGQEPVRSASGRQIPIGEPHQEPSQRPAIRTPMPTPPPGDRTIRTTVRTDGGTISAPTTAPEPTSKPSTGVPTMHPTAAKAPGASKPPRVNQPRRTAPGVAPSAPTRRSFVQRVMDKVTTQKRDSDRKSLPRRAVGAFRRIAGMFKRRLLGEEHLLPRTLWALGLNEERSSTTFKKCPDGGAMISTPGKRHSMPLNQFVNPDEETPTLPIRSKCRASLGGVTRSLQKDMGGANEATVKQVLQRINAMGGTRGKTRFKAWGTGVGGKRMETHNAKGQKAKSLAKRLGISRKKAAKLHGVSTGRPDNAKHTSPYSPPGGSKGPAGNREVPRATGAHAKPAHKRSKRKQKRKAASRAVTIGRGKALAGR